MSRIEQVVNPNKNIFYEDWWLMMIDDDDVVVDDDDNDDDDDDNAVLTCTRKPHDRQIGRKKNSWRLSRISPVQQVESEEADGGWQQTIWWKRFMEMVSFEPGMKQGSCDGLWKWCESGRWNTNCDVSRRIFEVWPYFPSRTKYTVSQTAQTLFKLCNFIFNLWSQNHSHIISFRLS